jgi:hypothetical protein
VQPPPIDDDEFNIVLDKKSDQERGNRSSCGVSACLPQLSCKPLQLDELEKALLEILAKQRPINVPLVDVNNRIRLGADRYMLCLPHNYPSRPF